MVLDVQAASTTGFIAAYGQIFPQRVVPKSQDRPKCFLSNREIFANVAKEAESSRKQLLRYSDSAIVK